MSTDHCYLCNVLRENYPDRPELVSHLVSSLRILTGGPGPFAVQVDQPNLHSAVQCLLPGQVTFMAGKSENRKTAQGPALRGIQYICTEDSNTDFSTSDRTCRYAGWKTRYCTGAGSSRGVWGHTVHTEPVPSSTKQNTHIITLLSTQ